MDIQKRAIIKLVMHVELRVSVVSLLESGEQRYIKAVIIICQLSGAGIAQWLEHRTRD